MAIRKLAISNFKSIKNLTECECKKINIFIGEPNTGKSNILEALGLISQIPYHNLLSFVRLDTVLDLFYDHILDDAIRIKFDNNELSVTFDNGELTGNLGIPFAGGQINRYPVFKYNSSGSYQGRYPFIMDDPLRKTIGQFKYYRFSKGIIFDDLTSDFLLPPFGRNLPHIILTKKDLKTVVSNLYKKYGFRVVFKLQEGKIEVQKEENDIITSIPYTLSSETLQRITFYLAAIYSNKQSIITFEEPEAHAFPYYMKFLAEKVAMDLMNNQYFIITHNPYFLSSILEKTPKSEIATFITYYENYQTKIRELSNSDIENALSMGPDLFFNIDQFRGIDCSGK